MQFDIRSLGATASTNDDAKLAAEAGAAEGAVIWALQQSAGRGRRGREWSSPAGNLYCSTILRPPGELKTWGLYSFAAALAIGDTVAALLSKSQIELKWPNDVLVGGKKISGILLESGEAYLVVGIGLNVRHFPDNPLYPTTSLVAEGIEPPPLETILNKLLQSLGHWADLLASQGFAPLRAAWLARARKGPMHVRLPQEELSGQFADLDPEGNLRLRLADGSERAIATGDVFF